jgi:glycosyltransferase involved in cell wall biosynthesis
MTPFMKYPSLTQEILLPEFPVYPNSIENRKLHQVVSYGMKVCFFSPTAYSYFRPDLAAWGGGAETQQLLLARHMRSKGIEVSFIVGDFGQPPMEVIDGIPLIRSFTPFKGNRKLRFIPDMIKIRAAMRVADADIYNQRSTAFFTGQLARFASDLGKAFTFSLGIDYNCYPDGQGLLPWPMPYLYRYGIGKADAVIVQTEKQRRLMLDNFGRETVLIRNGISIPRDESASGVDTKNPPPTSKSDREATPSPGFLWVGRFRRTKRPDVMLDLARALPEIKFTVIGGYAGNERYASAITRALGGIPNVEHIPFVPPADIEAYYHGAHALINTSSLEGFPNTYLHAWVHGIPVIALEIDPDGVLTKNGIGIVAGDLQGLVDAVRRIRANPAMRAEMSRRAARYVRENHDIRDRGDDYIRLFEDILRSSR